MMRDRYAHWCVLLYLIMPALVNAAAPKPGRKVQLVPPALRGRRRSHYDRFLDQVFNKADTNRDGRMTYTETYEWVLRLYAQINRQAPVNPPTLAQVKRIVHLMDTDRNDSIGQAEFRALAEFFIGRATIRVAACEFDNLVLTPLGAEFLLRWFQRQDWLYEDYVVPYVPERFIPIVTNPIVGRTILLLILNSTIGGYFMERVNDALDDQIERREEAEAQTTRPRRTQRKRK